LKLFDDLLNTFIGSDGYKLKFKLAIDRYVDDYKYTVKLVKNILAD